MRLLTGSSRGAISALMLIVFGYQAVCASAHPCEQRTTAAGLGVAAMAGMVHTPGMAMPVEHGAPASRADHAPAHRTDCGSLTVLACCSACSLPSLASTMLASATNVTVAPVAYRSHLRPRSIDVSPDDPPPRA